uniref:peptidylprolyl isomerase n=1 Tax=Sinocyclocheilus anshuiensis TaxID=1608454 RepID=A0A671S350_9TELE
MSDVTSQYKHAPSIVPPLTLIDSFPCSRHRKFKYKRVEFWQVTCTTQSVAKQIWQLILFLPENCSQKAKRGDMLNAHYDGYLAKDGSQFYCSRSTNTGHPHWFVLGVGDVIKGLDLGLDGMCPGEKRKVTVPPSLAYGEKGKGPVPPNTTVIFEVELLYITRGPRSIEAFKEIDADNDKALTKEEVIDIS